MPPKPSSRKGVKKGVLKTESSAGTQSPSEYWNQLTDLQRVFFDDVTQQTGSNHYAFGAEIKIEMPSPTPASVANGANESEYSFDLTPVPGPTSSPFPCTEDDLTLCHAPTADPTGYPIFVSRNGRWDWYYLASNNNIESSATPANETTNGNAKNIKSEFTTGLSLFPNQFPCTAADITLFPCPNRGLNPANSPTFSSQNGRWEWIFLPSNTDTESSPPKVKMEDIPEANPRVQQPSNPVSTTFSAADLDRFVFPYGAPDSDDDMSSLPSLVENIAEQARTAKYVRFFMNTTHDKHFVPIEVPPLTGNDNWDPWLVAMRLLFRQHSVWPIVTSELQPLSPGHNLYLWYQRMRDCAIALIYANVSEEVRRTHCFMSTASEDDADVLMTHLYAHYSEPDSTHPHEESELD
ncbi:hypothetical protein N7537_002396 [Penicillium hordei]|uniref:Uncharacterized protein n=1 Tax=Penicillium hordei TaxID=40994 RepID=A0AAD6H8R7_9EURO|nr:uncharacterized protein N7537_002396 [Penicillium hordei]KAJ5617282.1 hypothetical protein N7537_002396 [Penicillium hordei]